MCRAVLLLVLLLLLLLPPGTNLLNAKNEKPLRAGQVFAVTLGVTGLENAEAADDKDRVYAIQVCKTLSLTHGDAIFETLGIVSSWSLRLHTVCVTGLRG
jgi:hypothetical protein